MIFGSLFTGCGGLDLGLEQAGLKCAWQIENDPACIQVLQKNWPSVPRYTDIQTINWQNLPPVDILAGGFPCQDVSIASPYGKNKKGITGDRTGLFVHFIAAIRHFRPSYVIMENVPNLLNFGFGHLLGALAESGYDAEWDCYAAHPLGAAQIRSRLFIVAYPHRVGCHPCPPILDRINKKNSREKTAQNLSQETRIRYELIRDLRGQLRAIPNSSLLRMAHDVPDRPHRYRMLGNAVCPAVAQMLGHMIMSHHHACHSHAPAAHSPIHESQSESHPKNYTCNTHKLPSHH